MSLQRTLLYVKILTFLEQKGKTELSTIVSSFRKSYYTIHSLFDNWMEDGYIDREEKEVLEAGKPMYLYYLTPKGKEVLTHLREMIT